MKTITLSREQFNEFTDWLESQSIEYKWSELDCAQQLYQVTVPNEVLEWYESYKNKMKKVVLTFKTPDVLDQVMRQDEPDRAKNNILFNKFSEKLKKWILYNEYIDIEFDLTNMTAKVLER